MKKELTHKEKRLIRKVQKLLSLGQDKAATQGEAEAAIARVHEILAQHNLDMAQVEAATEEAAGAADWFLLDEKTDRWRHYIYDATATLYFCRYMATGEENGFVGRALFGRPGNIETTVVMVDYFLTTLEQLAHAALQNYRVVSPLAHKSFLQSFYLSAAFELSERIEAKYRAARQQAQTANGAATTTPPNHALALLDCYEKRNQENEARIAERLQGKVSGEGIPLPQPKQELTNFMGMIAGAEAGRKIGLDRQIVHHEDAGHE